MRVAHCQLVDPSRLVLPTLLSFILATPKRNDARSQRQNHQPNMPTRRHNYFVANEVQESHRLNAANLLQQAHANKARKQCAK